MRLKTLSPIFIENETEMMKFILLINEWSWNYSAIDATKVTHNLYIYIYTVSRSIFISFLYFLVIFVFCLWINEYYSNPFNGHVCISTKININIGSIRVIRLSKCQEWDSVQCQWISRVCAWEFDNFWKKKLFEHTHTQPHAIRKRKSTRKTEGSHYGKIPNGILIVLVFLFLKRPKVSNAYSLANLIIIETRFTTFTLFIQFLLNTKLFKIYESNICCTLYTLKTHIY